MPDPQKENIGPKDADYADPAIVDKVSQHLHLLDGEDTVTPKPEPKPAGEPEPTPPLPKTKTEVAGDDEPIPEPEPEPATDEPTLPDNYYRAALHQGWSAEEVGDFLKTDPEKALKTFERIYKSTNELSKRFAQLGEAALKVQQPQPQPQPQPQQPAQVQDFVDIKKIREEHGDSPLVDMLGAMNESLKKALAQRTVQPEPQPVQVDRTRYEEDMAITQQLHNFFGSDDMKFYDDFYGASQDDSGKMLMTAEHLTPGQQANRMAVVRLADRILAGSELQGESMPVAEALDLAHLVITEKVREKAVRDNLVAKVTKRSKGITLKPSGSQKEEYSGPPKTAEELEQRTKTRAEKLLK